MKKILTLLSLSAILSLTALAAPVDGKWSFEGSDRTAPKQLSLKVNGSSLSGTMDGLAITRSGVAGDTIFFHVVRNGVDFNYKGQVKEGKIVLREAGPQTRVLTFSHAK